MASEVDIHHGKGFGFWGKLARGWRVYLVRCFTCGRENYGPNVASGICAWCDYDANKDTTLTKPK